MGSIIAVAAISGSATACELCRRLGTTAYHIPGLAGGDNRDDALTTPHEDDEPGTAHGAFVTVGGQWPQLGGPGTPITLTYSFQNMFDGALKMPNGQPLPANTFDNPLKQLLVFGRVSLRLTLWKSLTTDSIRPFDSYWPIAIQARIHQRS